MIQIWSLSLTIRHIHHHWHPLPGKTSRYQHGSWGQRRLVRKFITEHSGKVCADVLRRPRKSIMRNWSGTLSSCCCGTWSTKTDITALECFYLHLLYHAMCSSISFSELKFLLCSGNLFPAQTILNLNIKRLNGSVSFSSQPDLII